jgi:hypothetical protein
LIFNLINQKFYQCSNTNIAKLVIEKSKQSNGKRKITQELVEEIFSEYANKDINMKQLAEKFNYNNIHNLLHTKLNLCSDDKIKNKIIYKLSQQKDSKFSNKNIVNEIYEKFWNKENSAMELSKIYNINVKSVYNIANEKYYKYSKSGVF